MTNTIIQNSPNSIISYIKTDMSLAEFVAHKSGILTEDLLQRLYNTSKDDPNAAHVTHYFKNRWLIHKAEDGLTGYQITRDQLY